MRDKEKSTGSPAGKNDSFPVGLLFVPQGTKIYIELSVGMCYYKIYDQTEEKGMKIAVCDDDRLLTGEKSTGNYRKSVKKRVFLLKQIYFLMVRHYGKQLRKMVPMI